MIQKNYASIKDSMIERAMELWGIEDRSLMDPVVELLLDVFAYEFSKVEQEVKISDAKLLERISKILVQESWSLPMPAHALLRVVPSDSLLEITRNTMFYFQKLIHGEEYTDIFFTPLTSHNLIKAHVACLAKHKELDFINNKGQNIGTLTSKGEKQLQDYTVWIGIDIEQQLLNEIQHLPITLILNDSDIESYLKMVKVYDIEGNALDVIPAKKQSNTNNEHYFEGVMRYYQNYIYDIDISKSKNKQALSTKFDSLFFEEELQEVDQNLYWLKFTFPVAFTNEELDKLQISLNTFPVVNRKLQEKQHNIRRNGKIVSLRTLNEYFLNVETLLDNKGRVYQSTLKNDISNLEGSYSLYFGELEQFDERNAKAILDQVIQTVREEGSSFSAIGYDLLNAYLEDLNKKLNILERKVNIGYKNISEGNNRQYLLTIPYDDSSTFECQYWTTDAKTGNGIPKYTLLAQYQTSGMIANTIRLQTDSIGGSYKNTAKEKISNLRYGLISKDRIVSSEDIKEFVKKSGGKTIKHVDIKSGVGISPNKKQGLVRTTEVIIELQKEELLSSENKKRLSNHLQLELEHKSVHNLPYRVTIV